MKKLAVEKGTPMLTDHEHMLHTVKLAKTAGETGNLPIGAVIVLDDKVWYNAPSFLAQKRKSYSFQSSKNAPDPKQNSPQQKTA